LISRSVRLMAHTFRTDAMVCRPTPRLRSCEKIGFGHNVSHKIFIILRKTGVGFEAFSVSPHFSHLLRHSAPPASSMAQNRPRAVA
jgi:hypothetical protein